MNLFFFRCLSCCSCSFISMDVAYRRRRVSLLVCICLFANDSAGTGIVMAILCLLLTTRRQWYWTKMLGTYLSLGRCYGRTHPCLTSIYIRACIPSFPQPRRHVHPHISVPHLPGYMLPRILRLSRIPLFIRHHLYPITCLPLYLIHRIHARAPSLLLHLPQTPFHPPILTIRSRRPLS